MKEIVITSSVLILVIAIARFFFRGKVKQNLIYGMWLLVAVRLLIPVQFGSFQFSILTPAQPLTQTITEISRNPISGPSRQEIYQNIEQHYVRQGRPVSTPQVKQEIQTQVEQSITVPTLGQIATWVWLAGVAGMVLWFGFTNLRMNRLLRRSGEPLEGTGAPIPVRISDRVSSPCLAGVLRPVIYLTPESAEPHRLPHVLAHELAHYRHRDHIWSLVRCLCLCVYWFHPLVWLAAFLSRRDCELACDESALKRLGEGQRIPYGKTLLEIVSHAAMRGHLLQTATTMNETKRQLKERVNYIVKKPKVWITAVIAMVLVCAIFFGCAMSGAQVTEPGNTGEPEQQQTEPSSTPEDTVPQENLNTQEETQPGIPLTAEQIQQVNQAFVSTVSEKVGLVTTVKHTVAGRFFTSYYSSPSEMDLELFFYNYPTNTSAPEEEREAAGAVLGHTPQGVFCGKCEKSELDQVLTQWMGITSDGMYRGPSHYLVYVEEYDAYYGFASDVGPVMEFQCVSGEIRGNVAYLYSQSAALVLTQKEGRWLITAHLPLEEFTPQDFPQPATSLTEEQIQQTNQTLKSPDSALVNCFLQSYYTHPQGFSLDGFLASFPNPATATAQEQALALEHTGYPYQATCYKFEKAAVDEALTQWLGVTGDQLYTGATEKMVYLEEYGAYFRFDNRAPDAFRCLGGELLGDTLLLYGETHIVTLARQEGQWRFVSNMPVNMALAGGIPLTAEEIRQVQDAFVSEIYDENGDLVAVNLASCFFTSEYSKPEEINLANFLRHCPLGEPASKEERAAAETAVGQSNLPGTCRKFEKAQVDAALQSWMGITSDGLNLEGTYGMDPVYLEEYDAYYNFISDFGPGIFDCFGGEICGDTGYLYSPGAILTLVQREGNWYIYSRVEVNPMLVRHG